MSASLVDPTQSASFLVNSSACCHFGLILPVLNISPLAKQEFATLWSYILPISISLQVLLCLEHNNFNHLFTSALFCHCTFSCSQGVVGHQSWNSAHGDGQIFDIIRNVLYCLASSIIRKNDSMIKSNEIYNPTNPTFHIYN